MHELHRRRMQQRIEAARLSATRPMSMDLALSWPAPGTRILIEDEGRLKNLKFISNLTIYIEALNIDKNNN